VFSAVFLYGAALTYGATGSTRFGAALIDGRQPLFLLGQALMIIGLLFKSARCPSTSGRPMPTPAPGGGHRLHGAVIKVGGFTALGAVWLNLARCSRATPPPASCRSTPTSRFDRRRRPAAAGDHHLPGGGPGQHRPRNFSALRQTSARRMVGYSSVAHAGYMLLASRWRSARSTPRPTAAWRPVVLLVGYAIATAGALTAIAALAGKEDQGDQLHALAGQGRAQPFHGLMLTVFIASFAGVPRQSASSASSWSSAAWCPTATSAWRSSRCSSRWSARPTTSSCW